MAINASSTNINIGESVSLSASGCKSGSLIWDGIAGESPSITVNPLVTTTYKAKCFYATGKSDESCSATVTINVRNCQLSVNASSTNIFVGESVNLSALGCNNGGSLIWNGIAGESPSITINPVITTSYKVLCSYKEGYIGCSDSVTITVSPCQFSVKVNSRNIIAGEFVSLSASGCTRGNLTWKVNGIADSTLNGNRDISFQPLINTKYTASCYYGKSSCDTTIDVTVISCTLKVKATQSSITQGDKVNLISKGCLGTTIWKMNDVFDSTFTGKDSIWVMPRINSTFHAYCSINKTIVCDTTISVEVLPCNSTILSSDKNIIFGEKVKLTLQNCPNTVVWKTLGIGVSKVAAPSLTTTYYAYCAYGDSLQYSCGRDSITIFVKPIQPVITDKNGGKVLSGLFISDTLCVGKSLSLSTNCPLGTKTIWSQGGISQEKESLIITSNSADFLQYSVVCKDSSGAMSDAAKTDIRILDYTINDVIVFPNPTNNKIHIKSKGCIDGAFFQLYTQKSELVYEGTGTERTSDTVIIDTFNLPSDTYILHIMGYQGSKMVVVAIRVVKHNQ